MKRYLDKIANFALSGLMLLAISATHGARTAARADTVNYSGQRRQVRACVLVSSAMTDANGNPYNTAPYVFYALDNRTDYKPAGWTFMNPVAPSTITPTIYNRWKARAGTDPAFTSGTPQSQLFRVGAPLTKNIGAYWEVNLDTVTDTTLSQFDVVFMPFQGGRGGGNVLFTANERELLRHYVDQGGTIWAENEGAGTFTQNTGQFLLALESVNDNAVSQYIVNPFHPLLTYPFNIAAADASQLGRTIGGSFINGPVFAAYGGGPVDPRTVVPILQLGNRASIYAGNIGAGHIVIAGGARVAAEISGTIQGTDGSLVGGNLNNGAVSGSNFPASPAYDLKFAYNLAGWLGAVPAPGANARRTGTTQETIGVGIAPKWSTYPVTPTNAGSGAVIFKNVTFFVDGNNVLHAYDISPQESLSFDGMLVDDGIPDFITGTPYDEIWNYTLGNPGSTRYSTPAIYSVYNTQNQKTIDVLVVTNNQGVTSVFTALPRDNNGRLIGTTNNAPLFSVRLDNGSNAAIAGITGAELPVPAAVYSDGVLFAPVYRLPNGVPATTLTGAWHVIAIDLLASIEAGSAVSAFGGNNSAVIPSIDNTAVPALGDLAGSLTVGSIRDSGTNASDTIVYVPTAGIPAPTGSTVQPLSPSLQALWFRTRNEPLQMSSTGTIWQPLGARANVPWFTGAPANGGVDLQPIIHVTHTNPTNGAVINIQDIPYGSVGGVYGTPVYAWTNGAMQITGLNIPANTGTDHYAVSADYAVDWPGLEVGTAGQPLTQTDLQNLYQNRRFKLYVNTGVVQVAGQAPLLPAVQSGVALGSADASVFSSSSGLKDQIMVSDAMLPDRIYSVTEQYGANNGNATRANGPVVNWMFSPMYQGSFDVWTIPPRLVNTDNFRSSTFTGAAPPTGQVVPSPPTTVLGSGNPTVYFQVVGQPVISQGTVYVVANAHYNGFTTNPNSVFNATVILALQQTITGTITPTAPIQVNAGTLSLQQPNFNVAGTPSYLTLRQATDKTTGEFTVDTMVDTLGNTYVTAFHVLNLQSVGGNDVFNTSLPFYITDNTGTRQQIAGANGFGPLDNLIWALVIPYSNPSIPVAGGAPMLLQPSLQFVGGAASSGASVFGSTLYYNATYAVPGANPITQGSIVSVDLNAVNSDPNHHLINADGTARVRVSNTLTDPFTGNGYNLAAGGKVIPLINPPLATENTVVVGSAAGLAALDNQVTLIADSDRLFEVDALGQAVWSMSSTKSASVAGNTLANGGGIATTTVPINRPTTARHTAANVFAIADTENNRVMQTDQGGQVLLEIRGLNNNMSFLRPGDPITLNHPSDVDIQLDQGTGISISNRITGVTYTYAGAFSATHYFIADSGNYRALEVVTAVDPVSGNPITMTGSDGSTAVMIQQVVFVTRSTVEQNAKYRYRTIQQFVDPTNSSQVDMIAAVDNVKVGAEGTTSALAGSGPEGPGGGLMIIQRYTTSNGQSTDGNVAAIVNSIAIANALGTQVVKQQPVSGPTFFREFDFVDPTVSLTTALPRYLMADNNGCYVLAPRHVNTDGTIDNTNPATNQLVVEWMLSDNDYYFLTGRHLHATSIQRLTQAEIYKDVNGVIHYAPHYLITNSYSGRDNVAEVFGLTQNVTLANVLDGQIHGEVFEIRGKDYYVHPDNSVSVYSSDGNANDAIYNGYGAPFNVNTGVTNGNQTYSAPNLYQMYTVGQANGFNILELNNPNFTYSGSSIVRMVPPETVPTQTNNGNYVPQAIQRTIGTSSNATTSYLLQQPLFSERSF